MPLDAKLARQMVDFFTKHAPAWICDFGLPPRAPMALAFAVLTGAGYDYDEIAAALNYSDHTAKTYIRDLAQYCVESGYTTRKKGLALLAHAHLASVNPTLLTELIRTDVLKARYPTAS